jgi:hypothetical protein
MMGTSFAVPIGMIIYGWTAERHVFWLVPDIGIAIFAFGVCSFQNHDSPLMSLIPHDDAAIRLYRELLVNPDLHYR